MPDRIDEYPEASLALSWHPSSIKGNDSQLSCIDVVNADIDVQLPRVTRVRPLRRNEVPGALEC